MSEKWTKSTIGVLLSTVGGQIKTGPFGTTLKAKEYTKIGVPLISVGEIGYGKIRTHEKTPRVSPEVVNRLPEYVLRTGDIVFARKGAVDRSAMVSQEQDGWFLGSDGIRLRPPESIDSRFLSYQLQSDDSRRWIIQHATGTTMASLNQDVIDRIPIVVPPLHTQRSIANILGSLDERIELNRRINQTLEAMAQAIFKSWFVDFDPVKAKITAIERGEDPLRAAMRAISGKTDAELDQMPREHHDQLAATAALFPDAMEESELGEIPEGWQIGSVDDLCISITSGGTPSRKNAAYWENGIIPWFKTGELHDGPLMDSEEHITEAALEGSSAKLWPAGTILFALYASPTVGRLGVLTQPSTSNQAAAGLVAKQEYGVPFLRRVLLDAREKLQNIAVGAAQQNINQGILKSHQVIVPPFELATAYSKHVTGMDEQQTLLATQSRTLAQLRDTLLPKLLSGELSVADLEVPA